MAPPPPKSIRIKRAAPSFRQPSSTSGQAEREWARQTFGDDDARLDFELELAERAVAADEDEEREREREREREEELEQEQRAAQSPDDSALSGGQQIFRTSSTSALMASDRFRAAAGLDRLPSRQAMVRTRSGLAAPPPLPPGEARRGSTSVVEAMARSDVERALASAAAPTANQTASPQSNAEDIASGPTSEVTASEPSTAIDQRESRGPIAALRRASLPFVSSREPKDAAYPTPRFVEPHETTGSPGSAGSRSPTRGAKRLRSSSLAIPNDDDEQHHSEAVVDYLDVVDPEVGALSYLTHFQNAVFVPHIPGLYDRRPVHRLPRPPTMATAGAPSARRGSAESALEEGAGEGSAAGGGGLDAVQEDGEVLSRAPSRAPSTMLQRATSAVSFGLIKPGTTSEKPPKHIAQWSEMDEEERNELDEHIRHLLTRRSKFRRGARGFWVFVKTPMGFIMTFYGLSITVFGIIICLFIFGWVSVGDADRDRFFIEIWDQVLCALFAAIGLGFAPFRAVDTYRMYHIVKYHRLTYRRRAERHMPPLADPNDLPRPSMAFTRLGERSDTDMELGRVEEEGEEGAVGATNGNAIGNGASSTSGSSSNVRKLTPAERVKQQREGTRISRALAKVGWHGRKKKSQTRRETSKESSRRGSDEGEGENPRAGKKRRGSLDSLTSNVGVEGEIPVLSPQEQAELLYQQRKFHASHTYYRYTETPTHRAFPLSLAVAIVAFLDAHSCLQATLGGCTWGIYYKNRPTALTATIITCSLSCNAIAGILIYIGGRRTKKREEVERRLRIALEAQAFARMERHRQRAAEAAAKADRGQGLQGGRSLAPVIESTSADATPRLETP